jgi:hypothetical protein
MKQATNKTVFSISDNVVGADASMLGLKPGEWPETLTTDLRNGQDFEYVETVGETRVYGQKNSNLRLKVYND